MIGYLLVCGVVIVIIILFLYFKKGPTSKNREYVLKIRELEQKLIEKSANFVSSEKYSSEMNEKLDRTIEKHQQNIIILKEKHQCFVVNLKEELEKKYEKQNKESLNAQRAIVKGQISEQMAPLIPGFRHKTEDCLFIGKPIDFLVFDGLSENNITGITLLEIKSGKARVNKHQSQIDQVVREGKVNWEVFKIKSDQEIDLSLAGN